MPRGFAQFADLCLQCRKQLALKQVTETTELLAQRKQHGTRLAGLTIFNNRDVHLCFAEPGTFASGSCHRLAKLFRKSAWAPRSPHLEGVFWRLTCSA